MTNYNERLDEILDNVLIGMYCTNPDGDFVPLDDSKNVLRAEAKQAITSLIKELVIPARSGREYDLADPTGSPLGERVDNRRFKSGGTMDYIDGLNSGYNRAIDEFEQNLLKELEEK